MRAPIGARAFVVVVVCVAGMLAMPTAQSARSVEIVDLMPLYWRFHAAAQGRSLDQQVRLFREMVVERRPEVYNAEVMQVPGGRSLADALPELYPKATAWTGPHTDVIGSLSREIASSMPRYEAAFRREFPDFAYAGRVYFMYSLGAFDGAVRTVQGRPALLFGLDVIAAIHGEVATIGPLLHHELFHAYHGPLIGTTGRGLPLYLSVWTEGLATLVARQMHPSASDVAIFGLPTNTPQRVRDDLPRLAARLRAALDSTVPDDYGTWFTGSETDAETPRRSGYYLGYLVAARIQQGRTLRELARLEGPQLRQAIDAALADPAALASGDPAVPARLPPPP
jgi:hypothetical protein